MITTALQEVGASRSIVIDEDDVILAGNGVVEAAKRAGLTQVQIIEADGRTLVAVRRSGLTAEQKRALAMYDNRTGELAQWKADQLHLDQAAGLTTEPWFTPQELSALLKAKQDDTTSALETAHTCPKCGHAFDGPGS